MSKAKISWREVLFFAGYLILALLLELLTAALSILIVLSAILLPCAVMYLWTTSATSWIAWVLLVVSSSVIMFWLWLGRGDLEEALSKKAKHISRKYRERKRAANKKHQNN
ncbi:MAG: hypothetical protein AB8F26_03005 [Phycisphaerales bacterium]